MNKILSAEEQILQNLKQEFSAIWMERNPETIRRIVIAATSVQQPPIDVEEAKKAAKEYLDIPLTTNMDDDDEVYYNSKYDEYICFIKGYTLAMQKRQMESVELLNWVSANCYIYYPLDEVWMAEYDPLPRTSTELGELYTIYLNREK